VLNRRLRRAVLDKLGITRQALSLRAKKLKRLYSLNTTDAVCLIADMSGVSLEQYLRRDEAARIKALLPAQAVLDPKLGQPPPPYRQKQAGRKSSPRSR
jgi:hypothetical protein